MTSAPKRTSKDAHDFDQHEFGAATARHRRCFPKRWAPGLPWDRQRIIQLGWRVQAGPQCHHQQALGQIRNGNVELACFKETSLNIQFEFVSFDFYSKLIISSQISFLIVSLTSYRSFNMVQNESFWLKRISELVHFKSNLKVYISHTCTCFINRRDWNEDTSFYLEMSTCRFRFRFE